MLDGRLIIGFRTKEEQGKGSLLGMEDADFLLSQNMRAIGSLFLNLTAMANFLIFGKLCESVGQRSIGITIMMV